MSDENDFSELTEDRLREMGGWSFSAPPGDGQLWGIFTRFYVDLVRNYAPGQSSVLVAKRRREILKKLHAFFLAVGSPGNVDSNGERTNLGRPQDRSYVLTEAIRRGRMGLKGYKHYSDLNPDHEIQTEDQRKIWFEALKSKRRKRIGKKRVPGKQIKPPVAKAKHKRRGRRRP